MMTEIPQTLNISTLNSVLGMLVIIIGFGIAFGKIKHSVSTIERTLHDDIKPDLKSINNRLGKVETRLGVVETKLDVLWRNELPKGNSG